MPMRGIVLDRQAGKVDPGQAHYRSERPRELFDVRGGAADMERRFNGQVDHDLEIVWRSSMNLLWGGGCPPQESLLRCKSKAEIRELREGGARGPPPLRLGGAVWSDGNCGCASSLPEEYRRSPLGIGSLAEEGMDGARTGRIGTRHRRGRAPRR
jgi:hypothetical protein